MLGRENKSTSLFYLQIYFKKSTVICAADCSSTAAGTAVIYPPMQGAFIEVVGVTECI